MQDRQWFILYVLVCLEIGIFLLLVPWTAIWERNYFLQAYPMLGTVLLDPTFRGAVSGLGIANLYMVLHDVMERRRQASLPTTELFPGGLRLDRHTEMKSRQAGTVDGEQGNGGAPDETPTVMAHEKSSQNV